MDCSAFPKCSAPICPKDADSLDAIWFPNEEICTQSNKNWVKKQRKIASKTKDLVTYYTYKMLLRNCRIGKAIKGIDPDKDREIEELKWLNKHPIKKELSEERKAELRERMQKIKAQKDT